MQTILIGSGYGRRDQIGLFCFQSRLQTVFFVRPFSCDYWLMDAHVHQATYEHLVSVPR